MGPNKVLRVISRIRDGNPDAVRLYTQGQCYNFSLLLKEIFPEAEIWYDQVEGHVYSKIGEFWYDIRGRHFKVADSCLPLNHRDGHPPHRWAQGV